MKQLATLIFILSSLICSAQTGYTDNAGNIFKASNVTSLHDPDPWPITDEITTVKMISIQPTRFMVGTNQVDFWIDMPVDELIHIILWEYRIDLSKMKVDLSKTKIKNFYYLMIGDDAAHIGRDKKLIVNDTLKAQKIITQAILNYHR